jgi:hypothetical protein
MYFWSWNKIMAGFRQILLVKENWESDAERKARYILNEHFEGKEIGCYCIWGTTVLSKEQVKDWKKPNSGVIIEDNTDHLGVFRANSNEAKILIEKYGHDMFDEEGTTFEVYDGDSEYNKDWKLKFRKLTEAEIEREGGYCTHVDDKGKLVMLADNPELNSITDRNDPRLTSRNYFVVPFSFHR